MPMLTARLETPRRSVASPRATISVARPVGSRSMHRRTSWALAATRSPVARPRVTTTNARLVSATSIKASTSTLHQVKIISVVVTARLSVARPAVVVLRNARSAKRVTGSMRCRRAVRNAWQRVARLALKISEDATLAPPASISVKLIAAALSVKLIVSPVPRIL